MESESTCCVEIEAVSWLPGDLNGLNGKQIRTGEQIENRPLGPTINQLAGYREANNAVTVGLSYPPLFGRAYMHTPLVRICVISQQQSDPFIPLCRLSTCLTSPQLWPAFTSDPKQTAKKHPLKFHGRPHLERPPHGFPLVSLSKTRIDFSPTRSVLPRRFDEGQRPTIYCSTEVLSLHE
jgi:hypothetical protein